MRIRDLVEGRGGGIVLNKKEVRKSLDQISTGENEAFMLFYDAIETLMDEVQNSFHEINKKLKLLESTSGWIEDQIKAKVDAKRAKR